MLTEWEKVDQVKSGDKSFEVCHRSVNATCVRIVVALNLYAEHDLDRSSSGREDDRWFSGIPQVRSLK
jgi:hypothetical protein